MSRRRTSSNCACRCRRSGTSDFISRRAPGSAARSTANACNLTLARGYASITGNGGHDGHPAFDGVWAANNPGLQEDFAWRHNHVITVAGKAITTKFYGQPIARSYMTGARRADTRC